MTNVRPVVLNDSDIIFVAESLLTDRWQFIANDPNIDRHYACEIPRVMAESQVHVKLHLLGGNSQAAHEAAMQWARAQVIQMAERVFNDPAVFEELQRSWRGVVAAKARAVGDELQAILGSRPAHDCAGWDCANCHERDSAIRALLSSERQQ